MNVKNWSQPSWSVRRNRLVTRNHCKTPTSVEDLSPTHRRVEWLEDCRTDRKLPATFPQHPAAVDIYRTRLILPGSRRVGFHSANACLFWMDDARNGGGHGTFASEPLGSRAHMGQSGRRMQRTLPRHRLGLGTC